MATSEMKGRKGFVAIHTKKRVQEITTKKFTYSEWHGDWLITSANDCQYFMENVYRTKGKAEEALKVR